MAVCAPALVTFRNEWNFLAPNRDKASDGCCASAAHSMQNPTSDHEPGPDGKCAAFDLDEDVDGVQPFGLTWWWESLIRWPDPRLKYIIYKPYPDRPSLIHFFTTGQTQVYRGANPHDKHMHHSIHRRCVDDTSSWLTGRFTVPTPPDLVIPSVTPPAPGVDMSQPFLVNNLVGDGGWVIFPDGAVWTAGNAQFYGSANPDNDGPDMNIPGDFVTSAVPATRADGSVVDGYRLLTKFSPVSGYQYDTESTGRPPKPPIVKEVQVEVPVPDPDAAHALAICEAKLVAITDILEY